MEVIAVTLLFVLLQDNNDVECCCLSFFSCETEVLTPKRS